MASRMFEERRSRIQQTAFIKWTGWVSIVFSILGFVVGTSSGHPGGEIYRVFQFPDESVPTIDGHLGDWEIVPESYVINIDQFEPSPPNVPMDLSNFAVRVTAGWNDEENKLYFAAEVFDDVHSVLSKISSSPYDIIAEDNFEIDVDADHSGGVVLSVDPKYDEYNSYIQADLYIMAAPAPGDIIFADWNVATWTEGLPWAEYAFKMEGDPQHGNTSFYEVALVPFDSLSWRGSEQSVVHDLEEGEIIGLRYRFFDSDPPDLDQWRFSWVAETQNFNLSDVWPHFVLAPAEREIITSVESITWGRIKAHFVK